MAKDRRAQHAKKQTFMQSYGFLVIGFAVIALIALIVCLCVFWPSNTPRTDDDDDTEGTETVTRNDGFVTTAPTSAGETLTTVTTLTSTTVTTLTSTTDTTASTTQETTEATTTTTTTTTTTATPQNPADDGVWNLRLVNKWHPMTQAESEQLPIVQYSGDEYCDVRVKDALSRMISDGSRYGLWVTSSYRSYSTQERLYENKVGRVKAADPSLSDAEAREIAASEVARPGTSEHNTGLAFDLLYDGVWSLEREWENGEAFDWLMAHCHEYGFILRFPDGKESITGVIYEPWHYRYVGVEAATEIMSRGITLEEYVQEKGLY